VKVTSKLKARSASASLQQQRGPLTAKLRIVPPVVGDAPFILLATVMKIITQVIFQDNRVNDIFVFHRLNLVNCQFWTPEFGQLFNLPERQPIKIPPATTHLSWTCLTTAMQVIT
jgi:hypothetical protein